MISQKTALDIAQLAANQIEDEVGVDISNETVRRIIERWSANGHVQQTPIERLRELRKHIIFRNTFTRLNLIEVFSLIDYILMEHTGEKL